MEEVEEQEGPQLKSIQIRAGIFYINSRPREIWHIIWNIKFMGDLSILERTKTIFDNLFA